MADSTITRVRKALAAQIAAQVSRGVNVSWYPQSGKPPPLIEVDEDADSIVYLSHLGASAQVTLRFTLVILVDGRSPESLTTVMDDLLSWDSASSVFAAVAADRTLGGVVAQTVMSSANRILGDPTRAELPVEITMPKQ